MQGATTAAEETAPYTRDGADELAAIARYRRAANYLAAVQVYLQSNALLRRPLRADDIKPRLLGHWGTSPGINLVVAHLNRLIRHRGLRALMITGPGHGAAANLANHFLDGSLAEFYPDMTCDVDGVERFVRAFSWPGGFPSHLTPGTPGTIHEGGELGYALATAFGAAMDDPDLFVVCMVGDGEAETGPTAGSWNGNRFLDPATAGAVLPILDVNGYKISSATITGTMTDEELVTLFSGYGWEPIVVAGDEDAQVDAAMAAAMDRAADAIAGLQKRARGGERIVRPRWPMIVLRTPKGWSGPEIVDGKRVEGTFRSHQVPAPNARKNPEHLAILESWFRSYRPDELFDDEGRPAPGLLDVVPVGDLRLGMNDAAIGGRRRIPLELPDAAIADVDVPTPGATDAGSLDQVGIYLAEVMRRTDAERNFRIFCPDELESNKLGAVLDVTGRAFTWSDDPESRFTPDGRVIEVLSEHLCEGFLEGYLKTGRHGLFPCYEAFIQIVDSMIAQYAKWLKVSAEVPWRPPLASLNILLTSDAWRQDHNGYSHQNPGFINSLLTKKGTVLRITLPPDANTLVETIARCLTSAGYINLVIATKQPLPQWLTMAEAKAHATAGVSIWRWASTDEGVDPDVVLAAAGMVPTNEVLAATDLLRRDIPELRVRVVNVMDLMRLESRRSHPHALEAERFEALFTLDRPIVFAFHGYPSAIHQLISARPNPLRFHVRGYSEEGITTTPFDMLVRNGTSRYQLAAEAIRRAGRAGTRAGSQAIDRYLLALEEHRAYILEHGDDPEPLRAWRWSADWTPPDGGPR